MTRNVFLSFILLLLATQLPAQQFVDQLRQIRNEYDELKSLHVVMDVDVFQTAQAAKPFFHLSVDLKKEGDNYVYHYGSNDLLMNERYLILVDRSTREMVMNLRDRKTEKSLQQGFQFDLDSMLTKYGDAQFVGSEGDLNHFAVTPTNGPLKRIELFIDSRTNTFKRLTYSYKDDKYVSIVFRTFDKEATFPVGTFSEAHYILISKNKATPSADFKNYQITIPNAY